MALPGTVVVIAHSLGASLLLYDGATDEGGQLGCLAAVYVNPLIGGSRYGDDIATRHRWLRPVKSLVQRTLFRPSVRDVVPENEFQQAIFGRSAQISSFFSRTVVLFTEIAGEEPDIPAERVPALFGQTREQLLQRVGRVVTLPGKGHDAPLLEPDITVAPVEKLLTAGLCDGDRYVAGHAAP